MEGTYDIIQIQTYKINIEKDKLWKKINIEQKIWKKNNIEQEIQKRQNIENLIISKKEIKKRDEQIRNVVSAHVYTDNDDISQFLNSISQFLLIN